MPSLYVYPENLESGAGEYPHYVTFTAIERGKNEGNKTVALYLPADALKSSYNQTYGDADFGAVGVALANQGGEKAAAMLESAIKAKASNPIDMVKGLMSGIGGAAGQLNLAPAMRQAALNEIMQAAKTKFGGAISALEKVKGEIINPHKAIIYTGPGGFRSFSFNYTMTPENEKEAKAIADIVHFFKWHMHPGTPAPGGKGGPEVANDINTSMSLTYPEEFQIKMHVNRKSMKELKNNSPQASSTNPLFRIKNCFMTDLSVDYATSGAPAFITKGNNSVPATTTMAMSFKETVLMTKNSIAKGF